MSINAAQPLKPNRSANKAEVAEWFGVSVVAVDAWIRKGMPYVQKGAKGLPWVFDLRAVAEWRFLGPSRKTGEKTDPEEMDPMDRNLWYDGERKRIAIERELGQLREIDEFRNVLAAIFKELAQVMETIPDVLEREYAIAPTMVMRIQTAMDDLRGRMAERLSNLDEPI